MTPLTPCMGGWCRKREHCSHYHSPLRTRPAERLCLPGEDGIGAIRPIVMHRAVGTWERLPAQERAAA